MREIKFRVWSFAQKGWAEKQSSVIKFSCELNEVFETEEYEFQQFTGLLDKNGNEIYEGDILSFDYGGSCGRGVVEYYKVVFGIKSKYGSFFPDTIPTMEYSEIIGNIFETPKLLK